MTSKPARPRGRGCSRTGAAGARSRGESRPRHLGAPGKIWLFLPCSRADSRRDCEFTEWDALGRAGTSPPERGEAPGAEWRCNCAKELAGESAAFGHIQVGGLEPGRRSQ
ncbi:uncharacterized protein [Anser cygnoides]|uniref:uncharacterized protein isoform X1 n=1 Tax=Anser cygnoides TaxID=8845 RepID=UPI0034D2D16C